MSLNKQQLDILKLFKRELSDKDYLAIKRLTVKYLAEKITKRADEIWEERGWTEKDMEEMLNRHERTPYNPKN